MSLTTTDRRSATPPNLTMSHSAHRARITSSHSSKATCSVCDRHLREIRVRSTLNIAGERAWELLPRKDTFLYVTGWMAGYPGSDAWPERIFATPRRILMEVRPFHRLPIVAHEVEVTSVDDESLQICTRERGQRIHHWNHRMQVEPIDRNRCRYTDHVQICAGRLTPFAWLYARLFYQHRHSRWRTIR